MSVYPILVEALSKEQAFALACDDCEHTWRAANVDDYIGFIDFGRCPECESPTVLPQFEPGERCGACRAMAIEHPVEDEHGRYCSRVCMLQAEHARTLRGAA